MTDNIMREMHPSNDESRRDVTGVENATVHDERRKLATPNGDTRKTKVGSVKLRNTSSDYQTHEQIQSTRAQLIS